MTQKLLKLTAFLLILIVALASSCQPEEPKEIEYTILPASLNFDATGGEDKFTVTITSPATVESVESFAAWCQVSTNGASPVNVMVTVDPYTYYEARTTTVVVNMKLGENKTSATVQITQERAEIPEWILQGTKWKLVGVVDTQTNTLKELKPKDCNDCFVLFFDIDSIRNLSGWGACNRLFGEYEIDYTTNNIHILIWTGTFVFCSAYPDEELYVELLNNVSYASIQENELRLYFNKQNYLFFRLLRS